MSNGVRYTQLFIRYIEVLKLVVEYTVLHEVTNPTTRDGPDLLKPVKALARFRADIHPLPLAEMGFTAIGLALCLASHLSFLLHIDLL